MCPQGCLAPPGGGILQNPGKGYLQAEYGNGDPPPGLCDVEALPKLLLLPLCFAPRMGLIFKPLPRLRACFLRNLTLPVYCLSLVLFPVNPICDSEPTKNSFQLPCPPRAISSWKNHILHY